MFAALAKFRAIDRTIQVRRAAARPVGLAASNDNLNRPRAGRPRLAARWSRNPGSRRLECRWSLEPFDGVSAEDPEPSEPAALRNGQCRPDPGTPVRARRIDVQARPKRHQARPSKPRVRAAGSGVT
jgi:hypothetical protein